MAAFRFNFGNSSNEAESSEEETHSDCEEHLKEAKELIFTDFSLPSKIHAEILTLANGQLHLRHVLPADVELTLKTTEGSCSSEILKATDVNSDLIPLVYEGGHKVWECSVDLVEFLFETKEQMAGRRVLELGCGAGLPGMHALLNGASVDFQDYNEEVLEHVTVPNILLNIADKQSDHLRQHINLSHCRFFAGDWGSLLNLINPDPNEKGTYDIILSSETIYNLDSQKRLYQVIEKHLKRPSGVAYIAGKTCYFGVGGGTRSFEQLVTSYGKFNVSVPKTYLTGVQREILKMKFKT